MALSTAPIPPTLFTWTQYYETITPLVASIAPGDAVSFSQNGATFGNHLSPFASRVSNTVTALTTGFWRIKWQVGISNPGQLALQFYTTDPMAPTMIDASIVGSSWGHGQLFGDYILTVPDATTYNVSLINPASNTTSINLLSAGLGGIEVSITIIYQYIISIP